MLVPLRFFIQGSSRGFTLVGMMITIAIISSLAVIALPNLIRARMTANESAARATLKTIAVALETNAAKTGLGYTEDFLSLTETDPPYLNNNYIAESPVQGYNYVCDTLTVSSYSCRAIPQICNQTGSKTYTVTSGAVFSETDCSE